MKISILLVGFTRSILFNIDKIKKLFKKYDCDFFLYYSMEEYKYDKYFNKKNNFNNLKKKINPKIIFAENEIKSKYTGFYLNLYRYWYKIYQLNNTKNNYAKINNINYDFNCVIRMDLHFLENDYFFNNINKYNIYTLNNLNDEFMIGETNIMNICCDLFIKFDHYKTFTSDFFKKYLKNNNINYGFIKIKYKLLFSLCNIIAISGDSGSGKTTLSKKINNFFNNNFLLYETDRYHKWERNDKNWDNFTHLDPSANYLFRMQNDLFKLKIGNNIFQVDYDHGSGKFTKKKKIINKKNIILCGLHSLYNNNINNLLNIKIYIDTDEKLKKYWKIERDVIERKYKIEDVLKKIKTRKNDFLKYINPQKNNSSLIINHYTNNNINFKNINKNNNINIFLNIISNKTYFIKDINAKITEILINNKKYYKYNFNFTNNNNINKSQLLIKNIIKKYNIKFNNIFNNSHDNIIFSFILLNMYYN